MLSFSGSLKIFVLAEPCDMRKGFNGLYGMVSTNFGEDPRSGDTFGIIWNTFLALFGTVATDGRASLSLFPR